MRVRHSLFLALLVACGSDPEDDALSPTGQTGTDETDTGTTPGEIDADQDGHLASEDCNDNDAAIHPGADELCNGVDDDCDDAIDEDPIDGFEGLLDLDQDGFGSERGLGRTCDEALLADQAGDCNDAEPSVYPGAPELCDGLDNDCDDDVDTDWLRVPQIHADIQTAIDAASSGDGICLGAGTWSEPFDPGTLSLTIAGAAGAEDTIFDVGELDGPMTTVGWVGQEVVLKGFTITGLDEAVVPTGDPEGFLRVSGGSAVLEDVIIDDNSWALTDERTLTGGILAVDSGSLTLRRVEITDNQIMGEDDGTDIDVGIQGGFLHATNADVVLEDVTVHGNTLATLFVPGSLTLEGLLFRQVGGTLQIDGLDMYFNNFNGQVSGHLDVHGALVHLVNVDVEGSELMVDSNDLDVTTDGSNGYGRGLFYARNGDVDLTDVTLTGNNVRVQADNEARGHGPLYIVGTDDEVVIDHLTAHDNQVLVNSEQGNGLAEGGGFWIRADAVLTHIDVRGNTLAAKLTHGAGGHVGITGGSSTISQAVFAGNTAGTSDAVEAQGGGLYLVADGGQSSISHATFHRNEASSLADSRGAGLAVEGTGVQAFVSVDHASFTNNSVVTSLPTGTREGPDAWCVAGVASPLSWNNGNLDALGTGTNHVDVAGGYVKGSGTNTENWDLTLKATSELIDAGDPDCTDPDGSVCDIGAYGGPGADW